MRRELPSDGIESAVPRLHARFRTPPPTIFSLVREATGQDADPQTLTKIVRGYGSEVYRVATVRGTGLIIRIERDCWIPYEQEAWAIEQARAAGVPVAEVLLMTSRRINRQNRAVMVQQCLPGRNLSDLMPRLSRKQQERVIGQTGEALRRVHSVTVGGFGVRQPGGVWEFATQEEVARARQEERSEDIPLLRQAGLTEEEIERGLSAIAQYVAEYPCHAPVICHGDLSPEHILADEDGNLTGIIDFGDFVGGPPEFDIAYWNASDFDLPFSWLLAGYGPRAEWGDAEDFHRRLTLCQTSILLENISFAQEVGNAEETADHVAAFRKTNRVSVEC